MIDTCVCCGREIPEGRQVCPTCESLGFAPDGYFNGIPYYIKTPTDLEKHNYQLALYAEVFGAPMKMPKPMNPFRGNTPYPSKYFIDRRFEPAREMTADDIYRAMKKLEEKSYDQA